MLRHPLPPTSTLPSTLPLTLPSLPRPLLGRRARAPRSGWRLGLLALSAWGCAAPGGQGLGAEEPSIDPAAAFFDEGRVHEIELTLEARHLAVLHATAPKRRLPPPRGAGAGVPAGRPGLPPEPHVPPVPPEPTDADFTYVPAHLTVDAGAALRISARWKGNSSFQWARGHGKKSWKLDLDREVDGQSFVGVDKLNLQNGCADATLMRESLALELYRRFQVPAARSTFARVWLSVPEGERRLLGTYTVVEQVDGRFLKRVFGDDRGLLVKPERAGDLRLRPGEDAEALVRRLGVKREGRAEDRTRMHDFVSLLSADVSARAPDFAARLEALLDVEAFLRWWAMATLLGDVDTLAGMGHNAYLYVRPSDGRVVLIPWDLNHAFGGMPMTSVEQSTAWSIEHPWTGSKRLMEHVLATPAFEQRFRALLAAALAGDFEPGRVADLVKRRAAALEAAGFAEPESGLSRERWSLALTQDVPRGGPPGRPAESATPPRPPPSDAGAAEPDPRAGERGPRHGPPMAHGSEPGLVSFVARRARSVRAQLAGESEGVIIELGPPGHRLEPAGGARPQRPAPPGGGR